MDIECDKTASVFLEQKGDRMIEKYYNGVIEQVAGGIGNVEHNSILVRYSNDFSIWDLESVNHYKERRQISFLPVMSFLITRSQRLMNHIWD